MKRLLFVVLLASSLGAQELTVQDAIVRALAANGDVVVERESVGIADALVLRADAAYEPSLRGEARLRERTDPVNSILSGAPRGELSPTTRGVSTSASVVQLLPTGGTLSVSTGVQRDTTNSVLALVTPAWSTFIGAEVRQPLLQNRKIDPARRTIRLAHVDRKRAGAALQRTASEIAAAVERAYWTVVAARRDVETRQSALELSERYRADTKVRIEAGVQPESELATATAEVERRRSDLVTARETLARATNTLRLLLGDDTLSVARLQSFPAELPRRVAGDSESIATARANRPELAELQARLARSDVEIEAAEDRLHPQVDLVASYTGRGLAGSRNEDAIQPFGPVVLADDMNGSLGRSYGTILENEFPDASIGVAVAIPLGNRAARQDVAIARAQRRQAETTLQTLEQRIAIEVRNAIDAIASASERLDAARAARTAAEVQLEAERVKFEAGTSNSFFVLTRENELAAAQLLETLALSDLMKANAEYGRATGTLLSSRGVVVDGGNR